MTTTAPREPLSVDGRSDFRTSDAREISHILPAIELAGQTPQMDSITAEVWFAIGVPRERAILREDRTGRPGRFPQAQGHHEHGDQEECLMRKADLRRSAHYPSFFFTLFFFIRHN